MFEKMPIKYLITIAYLTSILLASSGFALEYYGIAIKVEDWFARSGSLICVVSVLFMVGTIKNVDAYKRVMQDVAENHKTLGRIYPQNLNTTPAKLNKSLDETVEIEAKKEQDRHIKHEVYLLIAGTLIWGFGDVALLFI